MPIITIVTRLDLLEIASLVLGREVRKKEEAAGWKKNKDEEREREKERERYVYGSK